MELPITETPNTELPISESPNIESPITATPTTESRVSESRVSETPIIAMRGIRKSFGATLALAGVDLTIDRGAVLGLLGPNGAGKTTLVRILATLTKADVGTAHVDGIDVFSNPHAVRRMIGLAGQFAAVDEALTGRENLDMVGRLYGLEKPVARQRSFDALERLGLTDAADRPVRTYSGGMRRRLDLGASLVGRPKILILDEPTTGLDPRTRNDLWAFLKEMVSGGTTVLLTTQYLEEADYLADRIVVIDRGSVIAEGTSDELKQRLGGDVLDLKVTRIADVDRVIGLVDGIGEKPQLDGDRIYVPIGRRRGVDVLIEATRRIDEAGIGLDDLGVRRPSLDDVFLSLTGHAAEHTDAVGPGGPKRVKKGAPT